MMDYQALKMADAALGIADPAQSAAALDAQTVTATNQPFSWFAAKHVARTAPTGDWSRIVARARLQPALPPATAGDMAILAAINAVETDDSHMVDPADAEAWAAWQGGLSALRGSGDLSDATLAALNALPTQTQRRWPETVTAGHVQTARNEP